jgi:PKD repeat protein
MTKAWWRYFLGFIIIVILASTLGQAAYTIKPSMLPSPPGFTRGCHPSYDEFVISTLAADFTSDQTEGDAPLVVHFYDMSYGFADAREWDFGDGSTSTEKNPIHVYREPGKYDVSLTVYSNYTYETSMEDYLNTSRGQMTDFMWSSTDRELDYITVHERGSGVRQDVPDGWYPEPKNRVKMPSGADGAVGSASFTANEITLYNSSQGFLTERGYKETLDINGAYYLVKSVPYNTGF